MRTASFSLPRDSSSYIADNQCCNMKIASRKSRLFGLGYKVAAGAIALAGLAVLNRTLAKRAEIANPPRGKFMEVDGVRLHYVERGAGPILLLLHGNGSMIQDFESSGLIELASRTYRVIAFDRPGYGYSSRPRSRVWTPDAQAHLLQQALSKLGVNEFVVFGHSWGASVAIALALAFPLNVKRLVLASGYYYPSPRLDVVMMSGPAVPGAGDLIAHTFAPIAGRIVWPLALRKIFGPAKVPGKFSGFPKEMAVRPSQMRTSSVEAALMVPDAFSYSAAYDSLRMPVTIVAGTQDRLIDIDTQSARLHKEIGGSKFHPISGHGHMIHQTATRDVMMAIDDQQHA